MSDRSERLFERARLLIPGGVNSPARAFRSVGGSPRFLVRGAGARVWDEDGRDYLDYVCAWGPLLFGHAYAPVVDAVTRVAAEGVCFGAPTRLEVEYAEAFVRLTGWPEQVRVMNSGSEAAAVALRLARGATGRSLVLKFEGGYHGHADAFLREQAGAAPGVPASVSQDTIVAGYNDLAGVERVFERRGRDVAAVFVEPVAANMGVVPPKPGFLDGMRHVCSAHGALLVFDEVVTGFRLHAGGASVFYGVKPDLAVFGKIPGGGLPFGAVAGPRSVMEHLAPAGPVFHAGTFAGNPVTMAAGLAHLGAIEGTPSLYDRLEELGT
ncbi:MAG: aspartate aminotransferase family protein, partial [Vicinamibacterales bacterium]